MSRARLVHIERLRLADGEPLALDRSWLPVRVAHRLLEASLTPGVCVARAWGEISEALWLVRRLGGWEVECDLLFECESGLERSLDRTGVGDSLEPLDRWWLVSRVL